MSRKFSSRIRQPPVPYPNDEGGTPYLFPSRNLKSKNTLPTVAIGQQVYKEKRGSVTRKHETSSGLHSRRSPRPAETSTVKDRRPQCYRISQDRRIHGTKACSAVQGGWDGFNEQGTRLGWKVG